MPGALDGAGVDGGVYVDFQRIFADAILYVAFECVVILVQLSTIHFERFYRAEGHRGRMDAVCIGRAVDVIRNIPSVDQFKFDLIFWNICNVDFGDLDGDVRGFDVGIRGGVLTVLHVFVAEENAVSVPADGKARGQGIGCALILNFRKTLAAIADQSLRVIFMNKEPTHIEVFRRASAACGQRDVLRLAVLLASGVCDQADRGVDGNFRDGDIVCDVIHTIEIVPAASGFILVVVFQQLVEFLVGGLDALLEFAAGEDVGDTAEDSLLRERAAGEYIGLCAHGECAIEGAALDLGAAYGDGDCFFEGAAVDYKAAVIDVHRTLKDAAADSEIVVDANGTLEGAAGNDEPVAARVDTCRPPIASALEYAASDSQLANAYAHGAVAGARVFNQAGLIFAAVANSHSPEVVDHEEGVIFAAGARERFAVQVKDGVVVRPAREITELELLFEASHIFQQLDGNGTLGDVSFVEGGREVGVEVGLAVHRQRGDCGRRQVGVAVVAEVVSTIGDVAVGIDTLSVHMGGAFYDLDVVDNTVGVVCCFRCIIHEATRTVSILERIARGKQITE